MFGELQAILAYGCICTCNSTFDSNYIARMDRIYIEIPLQTIILEQEDAAKAHPTALGESKLNPN